MAKAPAKTSAKSTTIQQGKSQSITTPVLSFESLDDSNATDANRTTPCQFIQWILDGEMPVDLEKIVFGAK